MATFNELYDQAPGDQEIVDETTTTSPPDGYKPLSTKQRTDWNSFTRFLKDKNVDSDKEAGLQYLDEYKKDHPNFSITKESIPAIQYEFQQLKNNGTLPGIEAAGPVKTAFDGYMNNREVSPVDGWIGSITAKQGYPEISEFENDPEKRYWGTDYTGASNASDRSKGDNINDFASTSTGSNNTDTINDPSVTGENLKASDAAIRDYNVDYINSPKYAERLSNFYKYPSYIQNQRQGIVKNVAVRENRSGDPGYDSGANEVVAGEEIAKLMGSNRDEAVSHELSHATNNNDTNKAAQLNPKEQEFIFSRLKSLTPDLKDMYRQSAKESGKSLSDRLHKGQTHDISPSESKSDIDAFRYLLQKRGIYNAGKSDISKDVLEKAEKDPTIKKSFILKRLKENFDDKAIIEIMNKIAKNNDTQKDNLLQEDMA
jgi:hypothetical protein